jgi:ubiquinone/menaquinone biosynthesis C-methylase UbiE
VASPVFDALVQDYPVWWIDFLGEHNHIGGQDTTKWLLDRSGLGPGDRMLDCGAFVGAAARLAATRCGAAAVAADINREFLVAGQRLPGGAESAWVGATTIRLPFADGSFASVWSLDSQVSPREMSRVAAARATVCLCCEAPTDSRGGLEAFLEEWTGLGWQLRSHRSLSLEATQAWRHAEAGLVAHRAHYEKRYGTRGYLAQLDLLAMMVRAYERGEQGHGLFVLGR